MTFFPEEDSQTSRAVVDEDVQVYVLHRVPYPQVHVNGFKIKIKMMTFNLLPINELRVSYNLVFITQFSYF